METKKNKNYDLIHSDSSIKLEWQEHQRKKNNTSNIASLGQLVCPVCLKRTDDCVLIDRRLKEMPHTTDIGWGMCEEHAKLRDEGYIALVECSNIPVATNEGLSVGDAVRTGAFAHLKKEVWGKIIDVSCGAGDIVFVDEKVIPALQRMMK